MSCCNSNTQSQQSTSSCSVSDFFPAGYRVQLAHPEYPYYISVPVFLSEEAEEDDDCTCQDSCTPCCCPCCCHPCTCCCTCCPQKTCSCNCCKQDCCTDSDSDNSCGCGYHRIRCTTRFCR